MRLSMRVGLATSFFLTAFLCGFNVAQFRSARRNPGALRLSPAQAFQAFTRSLTPAWARASDDGDAPAPPDTYRLALAAIRRDYVGSAPTPTRLTYAGIDGMLGTIGDPYTVFWTPQEYKQNMEANSGDFVGIGARLDLTKDKRVVIIEPLDGSPAVAAGVLGGDIITAINGKPTIGMGISQVIDLIHGPEGSSVRVTVLRGKQTRTFVMTRSVVHTRIVNYRMTDPVKKIGYIGLGMFNEQADVQFDGALQKLENQGMKALVFDLRDNPGGLLQVAQDLASRFVADGPIVWVKEKNGHLSSLNVERNRHRSPLYDGAYPVVVLVNSDSASAAEIVSGAIQDSGTGILVGTRTYGKGLVQTIMPLADDSAVKITTQHYFTRDKHDINIKRDLEGRALSTVGGIKPNIEVPFNDHEVALQRDALRSDPRNMAIQDKYDPQLQRALKEITAKLGR